MNVFVIASKQPPRSSQTGLNFIGHKEHIVLQTQLADFSQVTGRRNDYPSLSLDGFKHYSGSIWPNFIFDCVSIAKRNYDKTRCEGAEIVFIRELRRIRYDRNRTAMEITGSHNYFSLMTWDAFYPVGPFPGQFHGGFHCLGASVHQQRHFIP